MLSHKRLGALTNVAAACLLLAACGGGGGGGGSTTITYAVGGTVTGLGAGQTVRLSNNGSQLTIAANGTFTFTTRQPEGSSYAVTVALAPDGRICRVSMGSGTVGVVDVTSVAVDCSNEINWVTNGTVYSTALSADGGLLYIAGTFTQVGRRTGSFVPVDSATGTVASYSVVNGAVNAQVPDGAGGWYLGGSFTRVNGSTQKYLVRLRADGSVDPTFAPAPSDAVYAVALSGDTLFVGGNFVQIGVSNVPYVAALDATTGTPRNWSIAVNGAIRHLAINGNSLYLAGDFLTVNGQSRNYLAAVDATTAALAPWNPNLGNGLGIPVINSLVVSGTTVLVGGTFSTIGGASRTAVAALDGITGAATNWDAQISAANPIPPANSVPVVRAMAVDGSTLYIGGQFTSAGGQPRTVVAALDLATGLALPWNPTVAGDQYTAPEVDALATNADTVFMSGYFLSVGSQAVPGLAALDKVTGVARNWISADGGLVSQFTAVGNQVWVGGRFGMLGGQTRNHIAAIDTNTGAVTSWNPDAPVTSPSVQSGVVTTLLVSGSTVYAAGYFERVGGAARTGLAALDSTTGAALPWNPQVTGYVYTMAVASGTLYVGGSALTAIDGQPTSNLAAFDIASGQLKSWFPDAGGGSITNLIATNSAVYVAGRLSTINGQTRNGIAAIDPLSGSLLAWNPNLSTPGLVTTVSGMSMLGNTIYIVGGFSQAGVQARNGLVAVDATAGSVLPWASSFAIVAPRAVAAFDDTVYVALNQGGGNPPAAGLMSFSASTGEPTLFRLVIEGWADSITVSRSTVYLGGAFSDIGTVLQPNLAFVPR